MAITHPNPIAALMPTSSGETRSIVVLLHGLARTANSLLLLEWRLRKIGFDVVNLTYPSRELTIEELADQVLPEAFNLTQKHDTLHIVSHSMGGILLRHYATWHSLPKNLSRTVMLAPPNHGTVLVDQLRDMPQFSLWNGKAGAQLGTGDDSIIHSLAPLSFECGVIAGNLSVNPLFNQLLDEENDGKVSVESTKVDGMRDHIVLPASHTFIMNNPLVFDQIVHFLEHGRFQHN